MIVKNYFGTALDFLPKEVITRGYTEHIDAYKDIITEGNTIYLMSGAMPDTDELYEVNDIIEFESIYSASIVAKINNLDFIYYYDAQKKERIIKKNWKDAIDFTYGIDGTISWLAIILTDIDTKYELAENAVVEVNGTSLDPKYNIDNMLDYSDSLWLSSGRDIAELVFTINENIKYSLIRLRKNANYSKGPFTISTSNDAIGWSEYGEYSFDTPHTETKSFSLGTTVADKYIKLSFSDTTDFKSFFWFDVESIQDQAILFSDSVGVWEDTDRIVITETLSGTQGSPNIFKDFTLAMRDTCNLEFTAEPTVEYIDNDPGVIIINAISDNVITNSERLQDLVIDGTTIGIENGQEVEIYLNGIRYVTNLLDSFWSVTIPAADISNLSFGTVYTVKVDCRDRAGNLGTASRDVFVKAENIAPVITIVSTLTVLEDSLTEIAVSFTDTDGTIVTKSVTADNGTVVLNEDTGIISYSPNTNFNGIDTIRVSAIDDSNVETIANVSVTVSGVNDIATLTIAESVVTDEDTLITIPFTATDLDGTIVSVTATASNGTAVVDTLTSTISYTPNINFNGGDTIVVTATDNDGLSIVKNVSVTVNAINDNPVIAISDATTSEDVAVNIPYNASDVEGGVVITAVGTNGTAVVDLVNEQIVFTPDNNYVGFASFDISVTDSEGAIVTKTVNVEVTAVNDNPIINMNTVFNMSENTSKVIPYTVTDVDGTVVSVTTTTSPNATIVVDTNSSTITYTPNTDFIGTDTFTVTATDNELGTDSLIITITVENVDVAAVFTVASTVTLDEDTSIDIPFTITDDDGAVTPTVHADNGTATISNGVITYTPQTNFNGSDTITLTSTDALGGISTATIIATINPINDNSIITITSGTSMDKNTSLDITFTVSDVDGEITGQSVEATNGTATTTIDTITYTPNTDYVGSDTIILTITDINNNTTVKNINVTVNDVIANTPADVTLPTTLTVFVDSLTDVNYSATDIDGDTLTITVSNSGAGSVSINTEIKTISYDAPSIAGTDIITLTVNDGTVDTIKTIDVTITSE